MAGRVINLAKFLGPAGQASGAFSEALTYATSHGVAAYKLPDLPYGYSALEPVISGQIMELHHSKHHAAYVTNLNKALEQYAEAEQKQDLQTMISLQSAINFNGGGECTSHHTELPSMPPAANSHYGAAGHINHDIFWTNLAPEKVRGLQPQRAQPICVGCHMTCS